LNSPVFSAEIVQQPEIVEQENVTEPRTTPDWITALRQSHNRLTALVEAGTPALTDPSYCRDWTVAQVLSHLGSGAEIFSLFLAAGLAGKEPPGRDAFPGIWEAWNARSPERQAADSIAANDALVERFENLDPREVTALRISIFGREMDAAGLGRMRLSEHAVHTWDVAVMADPSSTIAPDATTMLVDNLGSLAERTGRAAGAPLRIGVMTTAPDRHLLLTIEEPVEISAASAAEADATLRIPAEALVRLVYGRLDQAHTPDGIVAEHVDLEQLRRTFPGF
jgi:uncharacterized protein (TIGR03083 family)